MALEISVGPQKLLINQGFGFLVTEQDGQIGWPTDKGLYHADTRLISSWQIYADGEPWDLLSSGNISYYACRAYLTNRALATEAGPAPARSLGLVISRSLGGGLHEDLDLTNHGSKTIQFNLEIAIRSDFADLFEVKSKSIVRRGRITTHWSPGRARLRASYVNEDFHRTVTIRVRKTDTKPVYANGRISFDICLGPGEAWHACLLYEFEDQEGRHPPPRECIELSGGSKFEARLADWRGRALKIGTSNEEFYRLYHQSVEDMAALRLPNGDADHLEFVPAAGVPWYVALFGRDSLIVSLQTGLIYPEFSRGALDVLADWQAGEVDDYRDAQPGKIMHELRRGELAHFKLIPHTPYYGTADATPLYLIVLHEAWRSTGDLDQVKRLLPVAERCLEWIDQHGDLDGDGFQEYQTRSSAGYENQGWKDSGEALVYPDGSPVRGPKALCELQGYVYDAWRRMAEIYEELGRPERAVELRAKADRLFDRFNEAFWDEASGFYAFALDGDKKQVLSVASNPGHCLWSGIVPAERAARVVKRLMAPDMWSGWGIRTLSSDHPAYDPHSYQNGSVWPHDNGLIALGFRRYGFAAEAARIARDVSEAASFFTQHRLPELYAGLERTPTSFPVQYMGANVPQAWASGSCFSFVRALLGVQPDAPAGKLYLDPALPDWMPDIEARDLRVGSQCFDLKAWREGAETRWKVLKGDPGAVEHRPFQGGVGMAPPRPEPRPRRTLR